MRWSVVLIALLACACEKSIMLGSECPESTGPCPRHDDIDARDAGDGQSAQRDAGAALDGDVHGDTHDASHDASQEREAGPGEDAALDGGGGAAGDAAGLLSLSNGSFELVGDASAPVSLAGGYTRPTPVDPWYGCRYGMEVVSETTSAGQVVHPTEGNTFFVDTLSGPTVSISGLAQDLSEPLLRGQRYALQVDLWSEPGPLQGDVELQVASGVLNWLPTVRCSVSGFTIMGRSGAVSPGGWRSVCIPFSTDSSGVSSISILAAPVQPDIVVNTNFGARLFVDNLRAVPDCR
jgi:hypothetical protein